uniref:HU family DNA-binding protein n=1 Tax=Geminicoccus roseus TaxID=404900 RepID=UPI003898EF0E
MRSAAISPAGPAPMTRTDGGSSLFGQSLSVFATIDCHDNARFTFSHAEEYSMTLDELNSAVADKAGITKADSAKAVRAVLDSIQAALKDGDKVTITGFGSFEVVQRAAREGRNPQTGKTITIAESKAVRFKPGKGLKDAVG